MSAVIKTITPFIDKSILVNALRNLGFSFCTDTENFGINPNTIPSKGFGVYSIPKDEIVMMVGSFYQRFTLMNGRYTLLTDSHDPIQWGRLNAQQFKTVNGLLEKIEREYVNLYNMKMEELKKQLQEEERIKLENERKAFVEKQKESIIAKAKEKGYSIKEENVKGKIKLVLVRNTY